MEIYLPIVAAVSVLGVLPALRRMRREIQGTTLTPAWNWAVLCWLGWEAAWLASLFPWPVSLGDYLWYGVALLGLCPPMTVLGAKRPGARVWATFVVLPLLLVFAWPALVGWVTGFPPERLQLETPMLLGYGLVLVMGYGNYLGTRHSLPSFLTAVSLGWLVWKFAGTPIAGQSIQPIGPTLLFVAAALIAAIDTDPPLENLSGPDRLWRDFQEAFGMVWAKRVMDRVNQSAQQENWSARLEMSGFVWNQNASESETEETLKRMDHTMRWLFRRFADPEWIDRRLPPVQPSSNERSNSANS